ncbi:hypothetical protein GCM10010339_86950 [Streptomyces alanosinicus]|uniref:Uncharacterized protein n=1 Tax=Streptomyces alanosinicus TaxID=68171 RepID=A0A918YUS8_9ACTN|nr:hypothetical protein GCM10010339_86950 [Streptomyces alanosinicus]
MLVERQPEPERLARPATGPDRQALCGLLYVRQTGIQRGTWLGDWALAW